MGERRSWLPAAVGGALIAVGLIGLGGAVSSGLVQFRAMERSVEVKGLAEREQPANLAIWPITHADADNDLAALQARIEAKNAIVLDFLRKRGFDGAELSVVPPSFVDKLAREFGGEEGGRFRYTARTGITVYTPKVDAVRAALAQVGELGRQGIAVTGGDPGMGAGVQFLYTGLNDIKPAMIEEATRNARETATRFAADSQSTLGKIRRANQGQFSIEDRDASTPHIKKVRVVSTVEYYLQD
ncbi:SIMPL domain-containing protein [Caldimonas tepidiphila]|uniref:SIMPL domain-containing protein n=1 Tax=Caldimonas tepidiphila TaxID=2315841 RepID=UPI000E5C290A|nr:SIMPL domain-containing protein [Caldimonas tepidiphila]